MRESQLGFSKRSSQSTASFNSFLDSSKGSIKLENIKATESSTKYRYIPRYILESPQPGGVSAKYRYTPRLIFDQMLLQTAMISNLPKRIGHAQIRVMNRRKNKKSPLRDDWFGTAQIEGEEVPFATDHDDLEPHEQYHVVYEKIETPTGKAGIKIHDVI